MWTPLRGGSRGEPIGYGTTVTGTGECLTR
jgi:hypothetical protein